MLIHDFVKKESAGLKGRLLQAFRGTESALGYPAFAVDVELIEEKCQEGTLQSVMSFIKAEALLQLAQTDHAISYLNEYTPGWLIEKARGPKPETFAYACLKCKHCGSSWGGHVSCHFPSVDPDDIESLCLGLNAPVAQMLNIKAEKHGIENGWFFWPMNFDSGWLINCDGFEMEEKKF